MSTRFKHDWTWGHLRSRAEALNPFDYFKYRYYENWLGGISAFFIERGYVSRSELEARGAEYLKGTVPQSAPKPSPDIDAQVIRYLREGDSPKRPGAAPRFSLGDRVRVRDVHPVEHTRLPGYLRNKTGTIDGMYEGCYGYFFSTGPDGLGAPMPAYSVKFDPRLIWGEMSEGGFFIYADLFEVYLEPAVGG